ncbi:triphosphoribosyl-dephospho-CoA synthase, partial [Salmonella enterica subsp. enterica serovar Anatum]|nr:triphosphoribosyl-dephospho-CoA synthase [Salmonella enterica subsp. enterica serovar Anatum]
MQPQSLYDAWADLAWRAMLTEVNLSPKPGLVDRLNCG